MKAKRILGLVTLKELHTVLILLVKMFQTETFTHDLEDINNGRELSQSSKILNLNPLVGTEGITRVEGHLYNSDFAFDKNHPAIYCGKHHLTRLIVENEPLYNTSTCTRKILANSRSLFSKKCRPYKIFLM